MFGSDFCRFLTFSERRAVPDVRPDTVPIPSLNPSIVTIDDEALREMARPTFSSAFASNFVARLTDYYDIDELGIDVIHKIIFAQIADGTGADTMVAEELSNHVRRVQRGEADPTDGVAVAILIGGLAVDATAQHYLSKRWRGTPFEQVSENAGAILIGGSKGFGTVSSIALMAFKDALLYRGEEEIPEDLILYELELASRLTCERGSPARMTRNMFFSPRQNIIVVDRGAVDCALKADNDTCTADGCLRVTYVVRFDGTWDEYSRDRFGAIPSTTAPVPANKPVSPPVPQAKPTSPARSQQTQRGPGVSIHDRLEENLRYKCLKIRAEDPSRDVYPAQCYKFF